MRASRCDPESPACVAGTALKSARAARTAVASRSLLRIKICPALGAEDVFGVQLLPALSAGSVRDRRSKRPDSIEPNYGTAETVTRGRIARRLPELN